MKGKFVILQSIRIVAIKSKETRAVICTCRYSSGHVNAYNSANGLNQGLNCPSVGVDDYPCFSTFYYYDPYIDCEITNLRTSIFLKNLCAAFEEWILKISTNSGEQLEMKCRQQARSRNN